MFKSRIIQTLFVAIMGLVQGCATTTISKIDEEYPGYNVVDSYEYDSYGNIIYAQETFSGQLPSSLVGTQVNLPQDIKITREGPDLSHGNIIGDITKIVYNGKTYYEGDKIFLGKSQYDDEPRAYLEIHSGKLRSTIIDAANLNGTPDTWEILLNQGLGKNIKRN